MTFIVLFIGSAGAGKSSLVENFGKWIKNKRRESVKLVNLDPGAVVLPYKPDFNIRDFITVEQIMVEENLGPNGAIIKANEKVIENLDEYIKKFKDFRSEYILIDTPGQLELFIFKDIALKLLDRLSQEFRVIGINVIDSNLTKKSSELVIAYLFSHILSFRLGIEISNILHKSDLVSHSKIKRLLNNPTDLINDLKNEKGTIVDLTLLILKHLLDLYPLSRLISTSIYGNIGFAELYDLINEHFCSCGDLS
ncbi:MAG: ATP/GTP-binding protein [Candidatus Helarchaeota archaeon]